MKCLKVSVTWRGCWRR